MGENYSYYSSSSNVTDGSSGYFDTSTGSTNCHNHHQQQQQKHLHPHHFNTSKGNGSSKRSTSSTGVGDADGGSGGGGGGDDDAMVAYYRHESSVNELKNRPIEHHELTFSSSNCSVSRKFILTVVIPIVSLTTVTCILSILLFLSYNRATNPHSLHPPGHQRVNWTGKNVQHLQSDEQIDPNNYSNNHQANYNSHSRSSTLGKQLRSKKKQLKSPPPMPVTTSTSMPPSTTESTASIDVDEVTNETTPIPLPKVTPNMLPSESRESEVSLDPSSGSNNNNNQKHNIHKSNKQVHQRGEKGPALDTSTGGDNKNNHKASNIGAIASSVLIKGSEHPLVETKNGLLEGFRSKVLGRTVLNFLGIPYAEPPIGELRFQKPQPINEWKNLANPKNNSSAGSVDTVLYAKTFGPPCIQFIPSKIKLTPWISKNVANSSEDCLYLNIWVPEDTSEDSFLKTVMVWIHGGAFFSGSSDVDLYNGDILASVGDVIVVSLNYRLGALGFLTTVNDDIAPGNMGMYDQVLALQWIKENIEFFGGDPDNIVLFGQSAGATSAGLHMFSPLTKDIPSRLILQSGSPLFPKIYYENLLEKSSQFSIETGCGDLLVPNGNISSVLECLQSLPVESIVKAHEPLFQLYKIPFFPHAGDEFLPELPHDMIYEPSTIGSQSEILLGNNEDEGSFFLHLFFPDVFTNEFNGTGSNNKNMFNLTINELQAYITQAYSFIPQNQASTMSQFFLASASASKDTSKMLKATHDIIGDSGFVCPAVLFSELLSEYNVTVYHYLLNGRPSNSPWNQWMGTTHLDEVPFIFGLPLKHPKKYTKDEIDFSRNLINIWTTFAKTGKVFDSNQQLNLNKKHGKKDQLNWPPFNKDSPNYLEMSPGNFTVKSGPHKLACNLWKIIYDSFL